MKKKLNKQTYYKFDSLLKYSYRMSTKTSFSTALSNRS